MDPLFSKSETRTRFTDLDDAAEVGAEERRGGAGGPAPHGRGRRQHLRRNPLPWLLLSLCSAQRSAADLPLLLRWIAGAPAPCPVVRSDDGGGFTAAAGTRDLARCLVPWFRVCLFFVCCLQPARLLLLPEGRWWLWEWPASTNGFVSGFGPCCPARSIYISR